MKTYCSGGRQHHLKTAVCSGHGSKVQKGFTMDVKNDLMMINLLSATRQLLT